MLQLRVARVWMLADGRPEACEDCGLHHGVFYGMMNDPLPVLISVNVEPQVSVSKS